VLSSQDAYARWAAQYPPYPHNALMQTEQAVLLSRLPDLRGRRVLDLACGSGRYGLLAEQRGAALVIGLDNSAAMLAVSPLRQRALAGLEAIPLPRSSIDVILCGLALGHLPRLDRALAEMSRILRPDGLALISDIHPLLALTGGQRTFTGSDGQTWAVEHYPHLYADYHRAARAAGLYIVDIVESRVENAPNPLPAVIVYGLARQP
jgi:malonyl-CoA O-methyltransferase